MSPSTSSPLAIFLLLSSSGISQSKDIPDCIFDNTVDLSHTLKFPNGSYLFNGKILILPNQVAMYDYEIIFQDQRVKREPHPRGCLCKEHNCIKFCCHPTKEYFENGTALCRHSQEDLKYDPYVNVIDENFSSVRRNAIEDFIVLEGIPCNNAYPLLPDLYATDHWDIYENGDMLRYYDNTILKRSEYCLMPIRDNRNEWKLSAFNCPIPNTAAVYNLAFNILSIISLIFIVTSAVLYILLPEVQGLRGKCLIHYIVCLAMGNLIMIIVSLREDPIQSFVCSFMGFSIYFFYESSFVWANVIGYDLWQNAWQTASRGDAEDKQMLKKYISYAYGVAFCLTMILVILEYSEMPELYKPGIGGGVCWLNTSSWSAIFYFFGLNGLIFCVNIILIVLIKSKAMQVEGIHLEQQNRIHASVKSIHTYLLLLCILGISWFLNISSYIEDLLNPSGNHFMSIMSDIMTSLEGPLIFWVLTVRTGAIYLLIRRKTNGSAYEPQLINNSEEEITSQF